MRTMRVCRETTIYLSDKNKLPHKVTLRTLRNWITRGLISDTGERVTLEYAKIGGALATSLEAYERFLKRLNGEDDH